ncbi:hypothetical protein [Pyxidicoccus sp. MSG2]|uniref:hypothetical protein n=1 Tax=Pyxidicoccus sp. MSG2 TaxID=2996790 RepID=UPI00226D91E9|nr:hypothetical protein [Pyxidicoccus sp. MSG2]MCY1024046.1 hypothetical protein [Pyxidicoccus sp. MSG2]
MSAERSDTSAVLSTIRAVEARGWYVEGFEPELGLRAQRPGYGVVTALTGGALLDGIAKREEDFYAAAEATSAAGAYFYGNVPGRGWTALRPDGAECIVFESVQNFVRYISGPPTPQQTSAPAWAALCADSAGSNREGGTR